MEIGGKQILLKRIQEDAGFVDQLVTDYLKLKEENNTMSAALVEAMKVKEEAQLALRQSRGFSVYLKGKQASINKVEVERQNSLRQYEEQTIVLKITNKELRQRLDEAKQIEQEAKLAARQAKGFAKYLKTKSVTLEKQLEAAKVEHEAKLFLKQARINKSMIKDTMQENGLTCSEHSTDAFASDNSVSTSGLFDLNEFEDFDVYFDDHKANIPEELAIEMTGQ